MVDGFFCSFRETETEIRTAPPPVWTVIEGEPAVRAKRYYSNEDGSRLAGTFKCTTGKFAIDYNVWEFCHLVKGKCVITHESGRRYELNPGDSFVLEPGFKGEWEIVEDIEKRFVMHAR